MAQLSLFRAPGELPEKLPSEILEAACELLAEMLIVIAEKETKLRAAVAGEKHEQD
jgi:hypothetical protein